MRPSRLAASAVVCVLLVLAVAWFFEMPLERAVAAAPIIVASVGAAVGLVVLWTKVIVESLRRRDDGV